MKNFGPFLTPWGTAEKIEAVLLARVHRVKATTGGGYHIAPGTNEFIRLHEAFPKLPADKCWFEENCEWAFAAMALPELFTPAEVEAAEECADTYYRGVRPAK